MLHMNLNDDRPNTMDNLRELVEYGYQDIFVTYHGKEYMLYSDHGGASIEIPEDDFFRRYKDYDEMIKDPIFEGKTIAEIIDEIDATY